MVIVATTLTNALAIFIIVAILPGIYIKGLGFAGLVIIGIGLLNALIKPTMDALDINLNIAIFAVFTFFLNSLVFMFAATFLPGLVVENLLWSLTFGIVMTLIQIALI